MSLCQSIEMSLDWNLFTQCDELTEFFLWLSKRRSIYSQSVVYFCYSPIIWHESATNCNWLASGNSLFFSYLSFFLLVRLLFLLQLSSSISCLSYFFFIRKSHHRLSLCALSSCQTDGIVELKSHDFIETRYVIYIQHIDTHPFNSD